MIGKIEEGQEVLCVFSTGGSKSGYILDNSEDDYVVKIIGEKRLVKATLNGDGKLHVTEEIEFGPGDAFEYHTQIGAMAALCL